MDMPIPYMSEVNLFIYTLVLCVGPIQLESLLGLLWTRSFISGVFFFFLFSFLHC